MKTFITTITKTSNSLGLLPVRLVTGLVFAAHGSQKLFGWFGGYGLEATAGFFENNLGLAPGILWAFLAASTEFFGGILLIAGVLTRLWGALLAITMLVGIVTVHNSGFFAPEGMEYPLTLLATSLTLAITGAGGASVDRLLNQKS